MSHTKDIPSKKVRLSTLLYTVATIFLIVFSLGLIVVYTPFGLLQMSNNKIKSFLPYPMVVMEYQSVITFRLLSQNMIAVKQFYETQDFSKIGVRIDFSTPDGEKRLKIREKEVLNKMIEDRAIEIWAKEKGIRVSHEEALQSVNRKLEEYNSENKVKDELKRLYNWTMDDFQEKVVIPSLYQEKLEKSFEEFFRNDALEAEKKILEAEKKLNSGSTFKDVVKQFSDGEGKENDGEIGWFMLDDMIPDLKEKVSNQKIGVPSEVMESPLEFHIILIEETKIENEKKMYHLKQIFVRKKNFSDILFEKMQSMNIKVLSPEYIWNQESARVELSDQILRDFEKKMFENTENNSPFVF